ncbi:uncharacterized protein LOC120548888 [Perca fluviatilis]|uniref:uncharacterized protein LOC120548888 n=1 Tax=Perca fluviatilis TaxID=8168 RepID=UPI0019640B39|nr:uncharacterized protein LOC120548888 [Perca fluviatilis]
MQTLKKGVGLAAAAAAAAAARGYLTVSLFPDMKKQVAFAENQTTHRLHHAEAMQRSTAMNESKMALKDAGVYFNNGLKFNRLPAARCEPTTQLQHVTTIQIPKTITAAPFLKHAALTPAQKDYLYTMAASYSTTHVRHLITQHYMNVLHRRIRAGYNPEREDLAVCSVILPGTDKTDKPCSEVPTKARHKDKIKTSARNTGKSFLPKIPNRRARTVFKCHSESCCCCISPSCLQPAAVGCVTRKYDSLMKSKGAANGQNSSLSGTTQSRVKCKTS